jgi:hypothetical protein
LGLLIFNAAGDPGVCDRAVTQRAAPALTPVRPTEYSDDASRNSYKRGVAVEQGLETLREIAARYLALAQTAADDGERARLLTYASLYHELAMQHDQLESLARVTDHR